MALNQHTTRRLLCVLWICFVILPDSYSRSIGSSSPRRDTSTVSETRKVTRPSRGAVNFIDGKCPPPTTFIRNENCRNLCTTDADCKADKKCCENSCSFTCMEPWFPKRVVDWETQSSSNQIPGRPNIEEREGKQMRECLHQGKQYKHEKRFQRNCSTCVCYSGVIFCDKKSCLADTGIQTNVFNTSPQQTEKDNPNQDSVEELSGSADVGPGSGSENIPDESGSTPDNDRSLESVNKTESTKEPQLQRNLGTTDFTFQGKETIHTTEIQGNSTEEVQRNKIASNVSRPQLKMEKQNENVKEERSSIKISKDVDAAKLKKPNCPTHEAFTDVICLGRPDFENKESSAADENDYGSSQVDSGEDSISGDENKTSEVEKEIKVRNERGPLQTITLKKWEGAEEGSTFGFIRDNTETEKRNVTKTAESHSTKDGRSSLWRLLAGNEREKFKIERSSAEYLETTDDEQ